MKDILIIANGTVHKELLSRIYPGYGHIICADGGARYALEMGISPHLVVGDLDSLDEEYRDLLLKGSYNLDLHPVKKDATDLELALERAAALKPPSIDILGGWGGRWDHSLINLHLLARYTTPQLRVQMLDPQHRVQAAVPGTLASIRGEPGDIVSLIPLSPRVKGVTARGFSYPLRDRELLFGSTLPVSNALVGRVGQVLVTAGTLLIIHHFAEFRSPDGL